MKLVSKILSDNGLSPDFEIIFGPEQDQKNPKSELVLDRDALGRLRRELLWTIGEQRMHGMMARLGYSCGASDSISSKETPDRLKSIGALVQVGSDLKKHEFIFEVKDSCEAKEHLRFFQSPVKQAQCWLVAGYLTGAISKQANQPIYFIETQCSARKESCCRFVGKTKAAWGPKFNLELSAYDEDNMAIELNETREHLKQTKDRYQNLFEQSSVPIFIIDPETGIYLDANIAAEDLTGYSHDDLLTMNVFDLRPSEEHHQAANYLKALIGEEPVNNHQMRLVKKNGEKRIIGQSSKVLSYGGQRVIQTIMRDITDLKESEQKEKDLYKQLLRSERLSGIGRLAAGVAHELKNPLGAIRNAIYYIRNAIRDTDVYENDPDLKEIVKLAEDEVDSSVQIIGELLDFSRVVELIPRNAQINEVLEQIGAIINVPDNVEVKFDLDMTLPSALVDPDRLKQVFSNIVNNAIQAMPSGGIITIKTRLELVTMGEKNDEKERVTIAIEDSGSGIEPVHLKKIFEPLFTTKARGTGLGLAISNNIIQKHGGTIQVTSQKGKGTCFTIKLPLKPPSEEDSPS